MIEAGNNNILRHFQPPWSLSAMHAVIARSSFAYYYRIRKSVLPDQIDNIIFRFNAAPVGIEISFFGTGYPRFSIISITASRLANAS